MPQWNEVACGSKYLKVYASKIWNTLTNIIKKSANLEVLKTIAKDLNRVSCTCPAYIN